jgi:hypothetical protein
MSFDTQTAYVINRIGWTSPLIHAKRREDRRVADDHVRGKLIQERFDVVMLGADLLYEHIDEVELDLA